MKDHALHLIAAARAQTEKRNRLREYLQTVILRHLHDERFCGTAAFVGGTALRFLHQLPRYSEDLDFSLHGKPAPPWETLLTRLKRALEGQGYAVAVTHRAAPPLLSATVKFADLLFEAGLSPHKNHILSIRLELDTRPPAGAVTETRVVTRDLPLAFLTHDVPSLFAGKIHAVLARGFTKGRDFFDIGFYLSKWPGIVPNMRFLQNALRQTGWKTPMPDERSWKGVLRDVIAAADEKAVLRDVENFLERPGDREIFSRKNLLGLLK